MSESRPYLTKDTYSSFYSPSTLYARLDCDYSKFADAHDTFDRGIIGDESTRSDEEVWDRLSVVSMVEHEYFHCRSLLSTSTGYLLYLLDNFSADHKAGLMRALGSRVPEHLRRRKFDVHKMVSAPPLNHKAMTHYVEMFRWELSLALLQRFSPDKASMLRDVTLPLQSRVLEGTASTHVEGHIPLFRGIQMTDGCERLYRRSPLSLMHLIEGIAIWKEYAYLSNILFRRAPQHVKTFTLRWVTKTDHKPLYRQAVDMILAATGSNLATALPGVLLDIALSAPLFSEDSKRWSEAHPALRFHQILDVAADLPSAVKQRDACEGIPEEYYREIETFLRKRLGWSSVENNLRDTWKAITARINFSRMTENNTKQLDIITRVSEPRFANALGDRLSVLSTFLFPLNHPDARQIGQSTLPPVSAFNDGIRLNMEGDAPEVKLVYLWRIVVGLFVKCMFNLNPLPPNFKLPRHLFAMIRTVIPAGQNGTAFYDPNESFENFLSETLCIDYHAYLRAMRPDNQRKKRRDIRKGKRR